MVHDAAYLDMPETLTTRNRQDLTRFVPQALQRSAFVTTISSATLKRIRQQYPKLIKDGIVTHIPPTLVTTASKESSLQSLGITKPFILFVGNLEPRKNIVGLVEAYCSLDKRLTDKYQLVLAGGKGWNDHKIKSTVRRRQQEGFNIVTTGYVSDSQRSLLFSKATLMGFVSFYEGFGMPVLEAMHFGAPVLCSDIDVLHEVAGSAALYCNPRNVDDISAKLGSFLQDKQQLQKFAELGKARSATFTWQKTTADLRRKVQQIVESNNP
jgi:glycosyltransferase involved in cell wall biosynthesis